ncbi:MAG: hypothetical protein HYS17_10920 [Micavibrio aeruginosavorus]|uniref:DUF922 domain-containing protein n=1 Tax=Micavibrio aeruginosavorus TaxID=349221 RepID=A0A7T5R211_9BACT|nr:MAG: hypothetical protein HYS17_10920 [Micavibrio aeruginosavorus]
MPGILRMSLLAGVLALGLATGAAEAKSPRSAGEVTCTVPKSPMIQILPKTAEIKYDYSKTTRQLTQQGSNTVNPYAASIDTTTGGLRSDAPKMRSNVKMGTLTYPGLKVGCIWYDTIEVNIDLNPVISIAKEFQKEPCKSAIIKHELKHVSVDREVMNKYANQIGQAVKAAVNQAGALGPFNINEMNAQQDRLMEHIQSAINSQQLALDKEMRQRQAQVDSLEEYEQVSKVCKDVVRKLR